MRSSDKCPDDDSSESVAEKASSLYATWSVNLGSSGEVHRGRRVVLTGLYELEGLTGCPRGLVVASEMRKIVKSDTFRKVQARIDLR